MSSVDRFSIFFQLPFETVKGFPLKRCFPICIFWERSYVRVVKSVVHWPLSDTNRRNFQPAHTSYSRCFFRNVHLLCLSFKQWLSSLALTCLECVAKQRIVCFLTMNKLFWVRQLTICCSFQDQNNVSEQRILRGGDYGVRLQQETASQTRFIINQPDWQLNQKIRYSNSFVKKTKRK